MKWRRALALLSATVLVALVLANYGPKGDEPTFYLCGAAKKAWEPIVKAFENEYHIRVRVIYGSSGSLLNQLEMSRVGDIYSAATPDFMKKAIEDGAVDPATVRTVACLRPALLYRKGVKINLKQILEGRSDIRLAMCNPEGCAVGKYFKRLLEEEGLWNKVKKHIYTYAESFPKLVALLYLGEVDAVLGWHVAKYWYPGKIDSIPFNVTNIPCIEIALTKYSKYRDVAEKFIEFLNGSYSQMIFFEKLHYARPGEVK